MELTTHWRSSQVASRTEGGVVESWDAVEVGLESTGELGADRGSGCGSASAVDEEFEGAFGGMALMSGMSSFGRERASATTLAFPFKYLISVVYSDMQANW